MLHSDSILTPHNCFEPNHIRRRMTSKLCFIEEMSIKMKDGSRASGSPPGYRGSYICVLRTLTSPVQKPVCLSSSSKMLHHQLSRISRHFQDYLVENAKAAAEICRNEQHNVETNKGRRRSGANQPGWRWHLLPDMCSCVVWTRQCNSTGGSRGIACFQWRRLLLQLLQLLQLGLPGAPLHSQAREKYEHWNMYFPASELVN